MTAGLTLFLIVMALLVLRQSVILILFFVAGFVHLVYGDGQIEYLIDDIWTSVNREVLLAIPMFIVAGNIMTRGSIARRLTDIMRSATQWMPGGLGVATILSCAVFAAISGSSPVTLLAVGPILYPALIEQGYSRKYALGALASGGTLGVLIPPSIPMILSWHRGRTFDHRFIHGGHCARLVVDRCSDGLFLVCQSESAEPPI
jgi:C4-dicarboxylate transporter DctM subunit